MDYFEVDFKWYQHNSGAADNGVRSDTKKFDLEVDAIAFAERVRVDKINPDHELRDDFMPCGGHFLRADIFRVSRRLINAD